jgi:hypothetical protein
MRQRDARNGRTKEGQTIRMYWITGILLMRLELSFLFFGANATNFIDI